MAQYIVSYLAIDSGKIAIYSGKIMVNDGHPLANRRNYDTSPLSVWKRTINDHLH